ncbi:MAG: alpha/beta hydrolase [Hyphomicrobiaceae bacterium]|nr:alpha/beta hydrolase [Hyphomicrobiaceae bacterium]
MCEPEPQFLTVGDGERARQIAYTHVPAPQPGGTGLVWLIGLKSDMASSKATALADWAPANGFGMTRFDYSGHGRSGGDFQQATIGDWLEETQAVFERLTAGPQIVIGSSTGGHIALVLLRALLREAPAQARRVKGLVLIAPAWDLTEELMWGEMDAATRAELMTRGVIYRPSEYGQPLPITRQFIEEGRDHLLNAEPFDPGRPVVILQGALDRDVPLAHARRLAGFLTGGWAELIEIPDGEHRLARPQDLALLFQAIRRIEDLTA